MPDPASLPTTGEKIDLVIQMIDTLYGIKFWKDWPLFYLAKGLSKKRPISTQQAKGLQLLRAGAAPLDLSKTPNEEKLQNHDFLCTAFV